MSKIFGINRSTVGSRKDAKLVESAFYTVQSDLRLISIFHTDRGSEFKNKLIEQILDVFGIERSLSKKGTPYDNTVAEAMYSVIKTEFTFDREFADLAELSCLGLTMLIGITTSEFTAVLIT
jgi:transposase InsO family protein